MSKRILIIILSLFVCLFAVGQKTAKKTRVSHESVDLGLSVNWATCNVGANKPEDYGYYFAWGETKSKKVYNGSTYFDWPIMKYKCTGPKTILEPSDDAAYRNWGGSWRMPTLEEIRELQRCNWTWVTQDGVNGYRVTGPNGNSIFLPAAGYHDQNNKDLNSAGKSGYYWSRSNSPRWGRAAWGLFFGADNHSCQIDAGDRLQGFSVRPVCPRKSTTSERKATASVKTNMHNKHKFVDLGLSVKWATCNVGAKKPEEYGCYFAWGETKTKDVYSESTYKKSLYTKYNLDGGKTTLDLEDDAAHVNWGGKWRMPTKAEQDELRNECTWRKEKVDSIEGYRITGPSGNSIFLPIAGARWDTGTYNVGMECHYMANSLDERHKGEANAINTCVFDTGNPDDRENGLSVRAVCP